MIRIKTLVLLLLLAMSFPSPAQDTLSEAKSGYTGGFLSGLKKTKDALNFIAIGDWGRNGDYYQKAVAGTMSKAAATLDADFFVSVGDNFYPSGVQSVEDPQWHYSYENVYRSYPLNREWLVALGNHDYKGNIQAQMDYSRISRRWVMPSPYYSRKITLAGGGELLLVVLDSNPFIDGYYGKGSTFAATLEKQDTAAQREWLLRTLGDTTSSIKWKIVVGHHPLYSGGKRKVHPDTRSMNRKFQGLFDSLKVDVYLCGHEHDLQIIQPEGHYTTQFLSGAGCEVRPTGKTDGSLFAASEPGFMTFSLSSNTLLVQVVHANGSVLYSKEIVH